MDLGPVLLVGIDTGLRSTGLAAAPAIARLWRWRGSAGDGGERRRTVLAHEAATACVQGRKIATLGDAARACRELRANIAEWLRRVRREERALVCCVERPVAMPGRGQWAMAGYVAAAEAVMRLAEADETEVAVVLPLTASQVRSLVWKGQPTAEDRRWLCGLFGVGAVPRHVEDALACLYVAWLFLADSTVHRKLVEVADVWRGSLDDLPAPAE